MSCESESGTREGQTMVLSCGGYVKHSLGSQQEASSGRIEE